MTTHELPPVPRRRHRVFGGLTERQERTFTGIAGLVVIAFMIGWVGAVHQALEQRSEVARQQAAIGIRTPAPTVTPTRQIASTLLASGPKTAYISDAMMQFLSPLRGASGKLLFTTRVPGAPIVKNAPAGGKTVLTGGGAQTTSQFIAPRSPGIYRLAVQLQQATRSLDNFSLITLVPFAQKQGGKIGLYYLGTWPFENGGRPKTPAYADPAGFIQVTPQNENTPVSPHFRLRDFLTHNQADVWPKYLLLRPQLVDKLELTIQELQNMGHPVRHMSIMSGFRTPTYNVSGGNTEGRANLSRHMYGDASDVFVDNDGNGSMDDLNGDGKVDIRDAEVIQQAAERVEAANPSLVGGVGVYSACCGHGPFVHIDVRGYRARWRGFGNG
ncbi:MAG TPA: hypothetical protein VKH35_13820 [Thermoanaerobaculia bacterium]|nr:hypothetical protein [Thermoanaerobaculia bacterium]